MNAKHSQPLDSSHAVARDASMPEDVLAAIDFERLNDIADGNRAHLLRLTRLYQRTSEDHFAKLKCAVQAGDAATVGQVAHTWAGSSAMIGMTAILPGLREMEQLGVQKKLEQAPSLLIKINGALQQLYSAMKAHGLPLMPESKTGQKFK